MACGYSKETIDETIHFHGHSCPGLAIGIRASELAFSKLGKESDMVAIVETDMCGVDAIQYLTDCTYGKGNLIHRDYGKMAFNFYDRNTGKGFRALYQAPMEENASNMEFRSLMKKVLSGSATEDESSRYNELRQGIIKSLMNAELDQIFEIKPAIQDIPRKASILKSLCCDSCGEMTMESRTRQFDNKTLCFPCFQKVEQKI